MSRPLRETYRELDVHVVKSNQIGEIQRNHGMRGHPSTAKFLTCKTIVLKPSFAYNGGRRKGEMLTNG